MSLLEISHLTTKFETQQGTVSAVRDVSYHLEEGEVLGIVGESGSGKSVGMLTMMGLLASNGRVEEGEILFDGENISPPHTKDRKEKRVYEKKIGSISIHLNFPAVCGRESSLRRLWRVTRS